MPEEVDRGRGEERQAVQSSDESYAKDRNRVHLLDQEDWRCRPLRERHGCARPDAVVGKTPEVSPTVLVLPRSNELKLNLDRFLPDEGVMRVRIRAGRSTMDPDEYAGLRLIFGARIE